MNNLGLSMMEEGAAADAREWFDEATKTARRVDETDLLMTTLINAARAAAERGDLDHARTAAAEARVLSENTESGPLLADLACALAAIALAERRWAPADEWTSAALETAGDGKNPLAAADARELRARVRVAQGRLDEAAHEIARARAAYQALGADAAVARIQRLAATIPQAQP
jgi:ATP/maltotriose-dependent transcriptional regulator MalT